MARALVKQIKDVRRNYLINGDFEFWQRNISFSATGFTADRWYATISGTATLTRNTSAPPTDSVATMRYTSGGGASFFIVQALEDNVLLPAKGKVVTASVKIKRNSTYNANFIFAIEKNATANTTTGGSWSTVATTTLLTADIPTADYLTVSLTATVPNDGTANGLRVYIGHSGAAANGSILDMSQVMLMQSGVVATEFHRAGSSYAEELILCQRYYEKSYDLLTPVGTNTSTGREDTVDRAGGSGSTDGIFLSFKVIKRSPPSSFVWTETGTAGQIAYFGASSGTASGSASASSRGVNVALTGAAGLTIQQAVHLRFQWAVDAEI